MLTSFPPTVRLSEYSGDHWRCVFTFRVRMETYSRDIPNVKSCWTHVDGACGRAKRNTMGLRAHPDATAPNNNPLPIHLRSWSCQLVHNLYGPRGHLFHNSVLLLHISRYPLPDLRFEVPTQFGVVIISPKPITPSSCIPFAFASVWGGDSC